MAHQRKTIRDQVITYLTGLTKQLFDEAIGLSK